MTLGDYIVKAENRYRNNGSERKGQAYYNALNVVRPDLAERVLHHEDNIDPFYDDALIPDFLAFVSQEW